MAIRWSKFAIVSFIPIARAVGVRMVEFLSISATFGSGQKWIERDSIGGKQPPVEDPCPLHLEQHHRLNAVGHHQVRFVRHQDRRIVALLKQIVSEL